MTWQLILRFLIGGGVVSFFAVMGDVLKPKSFAGLFGAAPSVALATLALTIKANGRAYAAQECRSMIAGAAAFVLYAYVCMRLMAKYNVSAIWAALLSIFVWLGMAIPVWFLVLK
jgi:hypothetical protein